MFASKTFALSIFVVLVTGVLSAYRTCSPDWSQKGCKIGYHKNLKILIDDRQEDADVKIDWNNRNGYEHDLTCRCRAKADNDGFKWFVIEKSGICLTAPGELSIYLAEHPLDDPKNCTGNITFHWPQAPDGSGACVLGAYRAYFYSIETPLKTPEQSPEEEVAHNPAPEQEEEVAANPPPEQEEEVAANPPPEEEEQVAENPLSGGGNEPAVQECHNIADVVVLLDQSGSLSYSDFVIEKQFALQFLERFDLKKSRIAIITYDSIVTSNLTWSQSSTMSLEQLKAYVNNLDYTGGSTMTQRALEYAKTNIIVPQRRAEVNATVIVMTDGVTFGGQERLVEPAKAIRDLGCNVIAIGVGDYSPEELMEMTQNQKNIITKSDFATLGSDMPTFLNNLVQKTCV